MVRCVTRPSRPPGEDRERDIHASRRGAHVAGECRRGAVAAFASRLDFRPVARDYYEVLGVSRTATADELRKAHRALARKLHPDVNKAADAQAKFAELQNAYDVLSDVGKRERYDQFGEAGVTGAGGGGGGGGWPPGGAGGHGQANEEDLRDFFDQHFGGGGFGGFGSGGAAPGGAGRSARGAGRGRKRRGEDIDAEVHVAFETAALGGNASLRLHGEGIDKTIDVKIPSGVGEGSTVRLRGQGHAGAGGGEPGDLLVHIHVAPHPWFTREGLHLSVHIPVSIVECSMGATVDVPLLRGTATVRVPAGTSSGKRIRLGGQGIATGRGETGDLFVIVDVVAPTDLSASARESLESLRDAVGNPRAKSPWNSA